MRLEPLSPTDVFVMRLRRRRERHGITLDDVATATRVKREMFEQFERGDLAGWPSGLYARAWMRGYARAIGADEDEAVEEFCRLFPQGDRRAGRTIADLGEILALQVGVEDPLPAGGGRRSTDRLRPAPPRSFPQRARAVARLVMEIRHPADLFAWLRQTWLMLRPGAGGDLPTRH